MPVFGARLPAHSLILFLEVDSLSKGRDFFFDSYLFHANQVKIP